MRLIIHLQFSCFLSCSCLCSSLRRQGLAFLARSARYMSRLITRGVVVLRLQGSICVILHHNDSYLYLMEDRDPRSHLVATGKTGSEGTKRDILSSEEGSRNSTLLRFISNTTPYTRNQFIPRIASMPCPGMTMNYRW